MATKGVTGDFARLNDLVKRLAVVAGAQFKKDLATTMAAAAVAQVQKEFQTSRDPYGTQWKPLGPKGRQGQVLRDTGRLMNSFSGKPADNGFAVATRVDYAAVHQYGATIKDHQRSAQTLAFKNKGGFLPRAAASKRTTAVKVAITQARIQKSYKIPRRQMVPENETGGIGPIWGEAFNKDADAAMRTLMGGV